LRGGRRIKTANVDTAEALSSERVSKGGRGERVVEND
jgi:hypothetical protein